MIVVASVMLMLPAGAGAAQRLHGVVLTVTPRTGEAIVRHDAFGGMPAMTMPFRIVPRERAAQLQPGAVIDADVSTATDPWTLRNVTSTAALAAPVSPIRNIPPLHVGDTVPDVPSMVDQAGKPFRFSALRGSDVVLAFIYTRCQDARMCPLISAKFRQLQQAIGARPIRLVEATLDPTYDRPPVLQRYAAVFGARYPRWQLVVGDAQPTLDFAQRFGVGAFADPSIGIIHDEDTVIVDRSGRIRQMITDTAWAPGEIVAQVDADEGKASSPLARFNLWLSSAAVALCGNSVAGFSGLVDLLVVCLIFLAVGYLVYRLARKLFAESG